MSCGSNNGVVVAVRHPQPPLDGQNQPDARPGVKALGVGHDKHLADGVAFADDRPTSTSARPASFRPEIDVGGRSIRVLVEQVGVVDASRIGEALKTVLGLR
jgi:hypothetical protein